MNELPALHGPFQLARIICAWPDLLEASAEAVVVLRRAAEELGGGYFARAADDLEIALAKATGDHGRPETTGG